MAEAYFAGLRPFLLPLFTELPRRQASGFERLLRSSR
jgi:hypothetical protein